jgi:hypothetical protein
MKRFSRALVAVVAVIAAVPARAADDWTFKDSAGATQTIRAFGDGSNRKMNAHVNVDASGSERFTTANPGYVVLPSGAIVSISSSGITSIDAKTPALVGGRVPVDGSGVTQPVSSGALGLPADPAWDGTSTSASIVSILKGLPRTAGTGGGAASSVAVTSLPALAAGANVIGSVNVVGGNSVAVKVDGSATTQPVSGSVTVPGVATATNQSAANTSLASIDGKVAPLVGGRAPVDGSGVTQPISAATLPLPSGASTLSAQTTGNTSLASIAASSGAPSDAVWDGAAASASQPSLLKSIWTKLSGLLTVDTVVRSTSADRGGTITAGGTAQQFMAANTSRRGYVIQNQSTGDLYVNCLATAAANQTSLKVPAGALYSTDPHHSGTGACSIYGATTAQAFYAREF